MRLTGSTGAVVQFHVLTGLKKPSVRPDLVMYNLVLDVPILCWNIACYKLDLVALGMVYANLFTYTIHSSYLAS